MSRSSNAQALESILAKRNMDVLEKHISINSRDARSNFARIVDTARNDQNTLVITEHGEPAAALISINDLKILDWIQKRNIKDMISDAVFSDMTFDEFKKNLEQTPESPEDVDVQKNHDRRNAS
jgi:prevent-host-death family protein